MDSSRLIITAVCLLLSTTFSSVESQVAPSFIDRPTNKSGTVHTTVFFQCQATGDPAPTIKWVKYTPDNKETVITTSGKFVITFGNIYLYILGIQWSDARRYGCVAQNANGRIVADAYLSVVTVSPPTWHVKPHNVTLYTGQQYTLPCKTYGYPEPTHVWLKDHYPILDNDLVEAKDLTFLVARSWHSGIYTCTATNRHGAISASAYVKVVADPSIVFHPENVSAVRLAAITLSCGVVGSPKSLSVNWSKNNKDLVADALINFTQQTWNNIQIYSLNIENVRKRHLGKYRCIVGNGKRHITSNVAVVSHTSCYDNNIHCAWWASTGECQKNPAYMIPNCKKSCGKCIESIIPLQIEVPRPNVITTEGDDIELLCIFIGTPTPQLTWYKDGRKLSDKGIQIIVPMNNKCEAILKLSSVSPSVTGKYVCKGDSIAGTVEGNITLIVTGSAPYVVPANPLKEAKKDSNVNLQFVVMTTATPDITWYKDGKQQKSAGLTKSQANGTYSAELQIKSAQYGDGGFYTCMAQNQFGTSSGNVTLVVRGIPEVPTNVTVKRKSRNTLLVSWIPGYNGGADATFTVQYQKSGSNTWTSVDATGVNATSTVLSNSEGWVGLFVFRVKAVNQFGYSQSREVSVALKGKTNSPEQRTDSKSSLGAILGGVIGGLLFIVLIVIVVLILRRMKKKKQAPPKPPAAMYEVVDSENNTYDSTYADATGTPHESHDMYSYVTIKPDAASAMEVGEGGEYAPILQPKQWEVPKRNVRLEKTLGSGHFGKVIKGFLKTKQGSQIVAVKMLKENADQQQKKEFLDELELMKNMAPHPNIVSLVGCCTKSDQPFIIVEFCSLGNLREFLRSSHGSVVYANMAGNSLTLTCRDLLSFAWQCARGMSYLASQKLVHRDLAARNILVDNGHVCKIADFGLARDIYEKKQYLKLGEADLPLRWMAIESIFQGVTTIESDIWSYGILLWEIVTLGANPYPGLSRDDVIEQLRSGYRMPKPIFCSDELYAIMWQCWQQDPASRPTFLELGKTLHRLKTAETLSIDLNNYDRSYINATEEQE